MRKTYRLEELDCANCAAKMEDAIRRIDGVESCRVNFLTQKMTIECAEEALEGIMKKAAAAIKRIEPDCTIVG